MQSINYTMEIQVFASPSKWIMTLDYIANVCTKPQLLLPFLLSFLKLTNLTKEIPCICMDIEHHPTRRLTYKISTTL